MNKIEYVKRGQFALLAILLVFALLISNFIFTIDVNAGPGQFGDDQITLNPGGGKLLDGSDGLRFTINSEQFGDDEESEDNYDYTSVDGQDGVVYRGTYQYCCSAGSPMLNIGGSLYGQAGPAEDGGASTDWDSIEVISTTGSASTGNRTSTTGNASAVVRYSIDHDERVYTMDRTVSYTYPNNYVTDSYSFVIPSGNTHPVKFYLGGDTAPGSDDSGFGVMLTSPNRTVISLNPHNGYQFGYREIDGSRDFDGATSQNYSAPYDTVREGGNIDFTVDTEDHDAGLMVQWNLGTTPGTYTGSLQQFVAKQALELDLKFDPIDTALGSTANLVVDLTNTSNIDAYAGGYYIGLPEGLYINGDETSNCDGDFDSEEGDGYSEFWLWGSTVAASESCRVTIPVSAYESGTYTITDVMGEDGDYGDYLYELYGGALPVFGEASVTFGLGFDLDKNGDSIPDEEQQNVIAIDNGVSSKVTVLEVDDNCSIESAAINAELVNTAQDPGYDYPNGLMNFTVDCGDEGYTTTVKQYYYDFSGTGLVLRKYIPAAGTYFTIDSAVLSVETNYGRSATVASYQVTDGGDLDLDGEENGIIVDPAGVANMNVGTPNTGVKDIRAWLFSK